LCFLKAKNGFQRDELCHWKSISRFWKRLVNK
jgi:hypothetical protein